MNPNLNPAPSFFVLITLVLYVSAAHSVRKLATLGSPEISEPPNVSPAPAPSYGWVDEKKCLSRCHDRRNLTGCLQFSPTEQTNMINSNQASASVTFNFIQPVKLDRSNYLVWKAQVRASIIANGLEGFVTGDSVCPDRYLNLIEGESSSSAVLISQRQENPEYIVWMKTDKLLQSWMLSSMVDNVLIMVINCESSLELWERLGQIFMSQSKARFLPLKLQIQSTKKGSLSVSDYFNKMKKIADSLAIGGNALSSNELIMHLLTGLDDSYESLVTNILTRLEKEELTVEEVYSMLLSHETRLEMSKGKLQNELMHDMTANFAQKSQNHNKNNSGTQKNNNSGGNFGGFTGGYGDNRNNFAGFSPGRDIVCQICFIPGHSAYKCKNRFNQGFVPRNKVFGGFRPRGGQNYQNFRNFAGNGQNNYQSFGRGFGSGYPRQTTPFQGYMAYQAPSFIYPQQMPEFQANNGNYHHGVFPGSATNPMFAGQATSSAPIATYGTVADSAWYLDSGATNHVTQDPDPGEAFLFVKNDGQSPLKLNVTISHPKTSLLDIEIPKQGTKKINISTSIGGRPLIVLNAGDGECVFLMGSVSNSDVFKHFSFYATHGTPVYGAYLLFLTVLIAGVTWACCKSRKSERQVDGVPYQDLEMAKPESLAADHVETVEVWDQDWGDKWDETEAVKSLSKHQPENGSTNGPTSRSDKDGWENDWDD